jgi:hypothetical protein
MRYIGFPEIFAIFMLAVVLFWGDKLGPAIRDLFRGGPRPPSHPIPADDSTVLNRPRKTERGAKQFLAGFVVLAAPFALLNRRPSERRPVA